MHSVEIIVWLIPLVGSIHFDENTTFSFSGCSLQDETMTLPCACLQVPKIVNDVYCSSLNPFMLQEKCEKLVNASYILQHNEAENNLQISLNLNTSLDMEITMFTGNCSFDCSGETISPCALYSSSSNYSTMALLGHELCIIHTRLYTFERSHGIINHIHIKRSYILLFALTIAAFATSTLLSIYIYRRGVKSVAKMRMRNLMELTTEDS